MKRCSPPRNIYEYFAGTILMWFDSDRLMELYYSCSDADPYSVISTCNRLTMLAKHEVHPGSYHSLDYVSNLACAWSNGGQEVTTVGRLKIVSLVCHVSTIPSLQGFLKGFYELWPAECTGDDVQGSSNPFSRSNMLHIASILEPMDGQRSILRSNQTVRNRKVDRTLRTLAYALGMGASPNTPIYDRQGNISLWQLTIWRSIVASGSYISPVPVWLLFLLHGADPFFSLTFDISSDDETGGADDRRFRVTGRFGYEEHVLCSPVYICEDHGGIAELARRQNWTVSLRDIVSVWFPAHAEAFHRLIGLNEERIGEPSPEELKDLRREFGFELDSWQPVDWELPKPLLQSWTGESRVLHIQGGELLWMK